MSPLYLYAILPAETAEPAQPGDGLAGEPLRLVPCSGLLVAAGEMETPPAVTPETLAAHDSVVRRLAGQVEAILPVRFGEHVEDEGELAGLLAPRSRELSDALEKVRGCDQMTLRVFGEPDPPADEPEPSGGPGARYLEARRRELERERSLPEIEPLRETLKPLLRAERVERRADGRLLGSAYHLVRREDVPAYLAAVQQAEGRLNGRRVAASGPWPPYAFGPRLEP